VSDFDEQLVLLPDGAYAYYPRGWPIHSTELSVAGGWKVITPRGQPGEAFCLRCGEQLFVIRLVESGDRTMEVLNRDGSIGSKLRQLWQLRGTTCNGRPHGTWTSIFKDGPPSWREYRKGQVVDRHTSVSLEYRNGELVDWYDHAREAHDLARVNRLRRANGLAELSVRDFLNATRVDPESHD
jgi:hypothetical protein